MDTGEFLAIDHSFTEGNKAYRRMVDKVLRVSKAMVDHTKAIHNTYHKKKCGWEKCNMSICRHTQWVVEFEELEFEQLH